jgi:hypothetical protein
VFDNFMRGWPDMSRMMAFDPFRNLREPLNLGGTAFSPSVDVSESDSGYEISAELPGIEDKDIELTLRDNVLTLKAEKKERARAEGQGLPSERAQLRVLSALLPPARRCRSGADQHPLRERGTDRDPAEIGPHAAQHPQDQSQGRLIRPTPIGPLRAGREPT